MRQRGFSLIELMVTVTIFAIVIMAALPSIGTWLGNTRIRNVADSLNEGLQKARNEAVRRNQNVSFNLVALNDPSVLSNDCTLSATSGSWIVSGGSDPSGHCADAPSTASFPMIVLGRPVGDAGGRVSVTAVQANGTTAGTTVTFNGFGRVAAVNPISQINVTSATTGNYRTLSVRITPAGLVRMCDPDTRLNANDPRKC